MGIRSELHPIEKGNGRSVLPPACFTMKKKEKEIFCKHVLLDVAELDKALPSSMVDLL